MPREHADLARLAGHDQHLGVALERRAFRRDDRDREHRMVGHYAAAGSGSGSSSGSGSGSGAESSPASCFARSTTCSIVPTM